VPSRSKMWSAKFVLIAFAAAAVEAKVHHHVVHATHELEARPRTQEVLLDGVNTYLLGKCKKAHQAIFMNGVDDWEAFLDPPSCGCKRWRVDCSGDSWQRIGDECLKCADSDCTVDPSDKICRKHFEKAVMYALYTRASECNTAAGFEMNDGMCKKEGLECCEDYKKYGERLVSSDCVATMNPTCPPELVLGPNRYTLSGNEILSKYRFKIDEEFEIESQSMPGPAEASSDGYCVYTRTHKKPVKEECKGKPVEKPPSLETIDVPCPPTEALHALSCGPMSPTYINKFAEGLANAGSECDAKAKKDLSNGQRTEVVNNEARRRKAYRCLGCSAHCLGLFGYAEECADPKVEADTDCQDGKKLAENLLRTSQSSESAKSFIATHVLSESAIITSITGTPTKHVKYSDGPQFKDKVVKWTPIPCRSLFNNPISHFEHFEYPGQLAGRGFTLSNCLTICLARTNDVDYLGFTH